MAEKLPQIQVTTPIGALYWVYVAGEGRINKLNGTNEFSVTVRLSGKAKDEWIKMVDDFWNNFVATLPKTKGRRKPIEPKSLGYKLVYDDEGNPTGEIDVRFKTGVFAEANGETVKREIPVFDAKANKINDEAFKSKIGNGSLGRVQGIMAIYQVPQISQWGVTFFLKGLQVVKLVEYTGGVDFDAVEVEDGFVVDEGFSPVKDGEIEL